MNEFYDDNLMMSYLTLEGLLHRYFAWKRREHGPHANPHRGQGRILSILKLQPEITQKEMTFLLDMRPQSLGELLTKMEKAGFITREASEQDRRIMVVKLTEEGAKEAEKMNQTEEESVFDVLSDEEREQFQTIVNKLVAAIEKEMPEEASRSGRPDGRGFEGFGDWRPGGFGKPGMEDFRGHLHHGKLHFPGFGPDGFGPHRRPKPEFEGEFSGREDFGPERKDPKAEQE